MDRPECRSPGTAGETQRGEAGRFQRDPIVVSRKVPVFAGEVAGVDPQRTSAATDQPVAQHHVAHAFEVDDRVVAPVVQDDPGTDRTRRFPSSPVSGSLYVPRA